MAEWKKKPPGKDLPAVTGRMGNDAEKGYWCPDEFNERQPDSASTQLEG
jgi:hypothetical protein